MRKDTDVDAATVMWPKDESEVGLAALHRGVLAATPPREIVRELLTPTVWRPERAEDLERRLLQRLCVSRIVIGEDQSKRDKVLADRGCLGVNVSSIKDRR